MSSEYWNDVAARKSFHHPLDSALFAAKVAPTGRVLDIGCGYGRILKQLWSLGYRNLIGVDSSANMIARATRENPNDLREPDSGDVTVAPIPSTGEPLC